MSLADVRRAYAREVCARAGSDDPRLEHAFASVPREDFLDPGPWRMIHPGSTTSDYEETEDGDPRHLYRCSLVAIDPARKLNNGEPSSLAHWIDRLALGPGDRVAHIGCGVGYYTAIMASLVGASGAVIAVEHEPELAARAKQALAHHSTVEVRSGDGSRAELGTCEAILVNAGATSPLPWLEALATGGRLMVPLTVDAPALGVGVGQYLRVVRGAGERHAAAFVSPVGIYHCQGARSSEEEAELDAAFRAGGAEGVSCLRTHPHEAREDCWLHSIACCLSRGAVGE